MAKKFRTGEGSIERDLTPEEVDDNFRDCDEQHDAAMTAATEAKSILWQCPTEEAMLAIEAKVGHECKRTDIKSMFKLAALPATDLENWTFTGKYDNIDAATLSGSSLATIMEGINEEFVAIHSVIDPINTDDIEGSLSFNDLNYNETFTGSNIADIANGPIDEEGILGPKNPWILTNRNHSHLLVVQTVLVGVDNTLGIEFKKYERYKTSHYDTGWGSWVII